MEVVVTVSREEYCYKSDTLSLQNSSHDKLSTQAAVSMEYGIRKKNEINNKYKVIEYINGSLCRKENKYSTYKSADTMYNT